MASGIITPAESHSSPQDNALVHNPIHPNHRIIQFSNDFNITDLDCTLIHTTFFESDQASLPTQLTTINHIYQVTYTPHLLALDSCRPLCQTPLPCEGRSIISPLKSHAWSSLLATHPDPRLAEYLVRGITEGFRIGFRYSEFFTRPANSNMPSALANPTPVTSYIQTEIEAGRLIGPVNRSDYPNIQVSRFGVIPKRSQPGKWRLILDLSFPPGFSVNDAIDSEVCSLKYSTVDDAAKLVVSLGKGTLMAKLDIAHAYRNIPVHPDDRHLLGMMWNDQLFIDTVLPFRLRSAPKIFSAVADTLEWILTQQGVSHSIHYLDDFFTVGSPTSNECSNNLHRIVETCKLLGVPLAPEKIVGPTRQLTFLGIEIDSESLQLRIPQEKLEKLKLLITSWRDRKAAKKRQLLSLIGHLARACKVVPPGRTFLRRIINLSCVPKDLDHWVRLNAEFQSDVQWWHLFLEKWNGISCLHTHIPSKEDVIVATDASGSWGCGAVWSQTGFTVRGTKHGQECQSTPKNLFQLYWQ